MFIFQSENGKRYKVTFSHNINNNHVVNEFKFNGRGYHVICNDKEQPNVSLVHAEDLFGIKGYTRCVIYQIENTPLEEKKSTAMENAISKCSKHDIFKKDTGRKIALNKLLHKIDRADPNFFSKNDKESIWANYFRCTKSKENGTQ